MKRIAVSANRHSTSRPAKIATWRRMGAVLLLQKMLELAEEIREFANNAGQQLMYDCISDDTGILDEWVSIGFAMDTLADATAALIVYQESGVGATVAERHLKIYGMFQAVTLQQQAILRLYELFVSDEPAIAPDGGWRRIGDVYKRAVRSPLENWRPPRHRTKLSQLTVTDDGFQIVVWDKGTWDSQLGLVPPEKIDPLELLARYSEEAVQYLHAICHSLEALRG